MRFPSFSALINQTKTVIARFPIQFIITLAAVYIALLLPDASPVNENLLIRLLCFCLLAFASSLAVTFFDSSFKIKTTTNILFQLAAIVISAGIMFWLKPDLWEKDIYILLIFIFSFHLAVSFAGFLKNDSIQSFWDFNIILFLRFLIAALYSAVIILGLFAALAAIDNLFDANIHSKTYLRTFYVIAFGFNTVFFLAGVPELNNFKSVAGYPKGLKIFTQYVLIPLMSIYLVILFLYEMKIIVQWELPKGYVSYLILGYAIFGILSLLLVYPIRELEENKWIKWFSKFFYVMMIPLLVLFILAIYKRLSDYGITEKRYILIISAIWLSGITLYFLWSKKQNIKIIPISLSIIFLLTAFGPLGLSAVSKNSQINRLKKLVKNINSENKSQITSVIAYLIKNHGLASLQSFTDEDLGKTQSSILKKMRGEPSYQIRQQLSDTAYSILKLNDLKIEFAAPAYKIFKKDNEKVVGIEGFDILYKIEFSNNKPDTIKIGNQALFISYDNNEINIISEKDTIRFDLAAFSKGIAGKYSNELKNEIIVPDSVLSETKSNEKMEIKLQITEFTHYPKHNYQKDKLDYAGFLLIRKK